MENNEELNQEDMSNEELLQEDENAAPKPKTYDVAGLLAGAVFGLFLAIVGITDILMGIIMGMFVGLVVGTFIKKK